jgi:Ca-activated chloride channel homolog
VTFAWPLGLAALLLLPLLLAVYLWSLRRQRRTVPYSSVALIRAAAPGRGSWRRHLPVALLLGALGAASLAAAAPRAQVDVPITASSVILALDVSGSMCATDVEPNRLSAAQAAVREFIQDQDGDTRIGLVAFAGFAQLVVEPSNDRDELLDAVNSLTTGRGTAIGAALFASIDAIAQIDPNVSPAQSAPGEQGAGPGGITPAPSPPAQPGQPPQPPPPNQRYAPEIVVLLTDGANTHGVTPVDAARAAAERGVRVYPIGFGTTNPTSMSCTAAQLGGNGFENFGGRGGFGGGGGAGPTSRLVVDEQTLRTVATVTGGTYFAAEGADQLQQVFDDLPRNVEVQQRDVELSAGFAFAAVVLVLLCVAAAARWTTFPN